LAHAQQHLHERLSRVAGLGDARRRLPRVLADTEAERKGMMMLFRRSPMTLVDVERELDAIDA
jgi:hypothetical protein